MEMATDRMEEVKSTAVVKYSVPKPANFMKLEMMTDLNLPPANWLSSSIDFYGLQHLLYHPKDYSSFRMSHMFLDCVDEVDVISDSKNVKNLLKLAYKMKEQYISIAVHRVGKTLLLDEFDFYKYLLRSEKTEYKWLNTFIKQIVSDKARHDGHTMHTRDRKRNALDEKKLFSKYLYRSLPMPLDQSHNAKLELKSSQLAPSISGPLLPEPTHSIPESTMFGDDSYNRNVVWTFEDIEMLIGTNLPIFGGGTHPCVSLNLRDLSKPINVLTGIDYWLDSLMSNVPEVSMCYHLNGIVQKYELVKTEDLPRLKDSRFSPTLIKNIAQSILSFLKSNATKEGHTYWLLKEKHEDFIKLYDLTSLCPEDDVGKQSGQTPFTVPVAMLLYRVARNIWQTSRLGRSGTIRTLLKNCVKLLEEEKYPEVITSSHYMLSDLYVPQSTNPEAPDLDSMEVDEDNVEYDETDLPDKSKDYEPKFLVLSECAPQKFVNKTSPPITGSLEEKCSFAIDHVASGLNALQYFSSSANTQGEGVAQEEPQMAKPNEPIPMPYSKLNEDKCTKTTYTEATTNSCSYNSKKSGKKNKKKKAGTGTEVVEKGADAGTSDNALLLKDQQGTKPLPTWEKRKSNTAMPDRPWKDHLKVLLYEKAVLVYATLSEHHYVAGNFGDSLRTIGMLARCQQILSRISLDSRSPLKENCLLGRAGDCCIMLVQNWALVDQYREQMQRHSDEDLNMMEQLRKDEQYYGVSIGECNMRCVFLHDIRTTEQILLNGIKCYEAALESCENRDITKRLGNNLNEIGTLYLFKAKAIEDRDGCVQMCKKASSYLNQGLECFKKVGDDANVALLLTNLGHLHRLLANCNAPAERLSLSTKEKFHYDQAFEKYKEAQRWLGKREVAPSVWDAIQWELSTTAFNVATITFDNPPTKLPKHEMQKEVIESLQKALQYCDLNEDNSKLPLYQYRASALHYKIANLYHALILKDNNGGNRKSNIQLSKIHYEKASKYAFLAMDALTFFTSQMQRLALMEYLTDRTTDDNLKLKHLQTCLDLLIEMDDMIALVLDGKVDVPEKEIGDADSALNLSCNAQLFLAKSRLQEKLKSILYLCRKTPYPHKYCNQLEPTFKNCYMLALKAEGSKPQNFTELLGQLHEVLTGIASLLREAKKRF